MNPFDSAWDLLKELSTEDLQQAARTGGIGMTPERREAYTDAGLPLSTGGGFRTMPDTEAQRLMGYQKTGSREGIGFKLGGIPEDYDPKQKDELAAFLHQDDTGGNLDMDDRLEDIHYMLTQGQSMPGPSLEQERQRIGRGERRQGESVYSREFDRGADLPFDRNFIAPAPGATGGLVPMEHSGYITGTGRGYHRLQRRATRPRLFPGEYGSRKVQEISNAPNQYKDYLDSLQLLNRNKATALPEGSQGPEQFPTSEFARRGDAGASASDKAFSEMKLRQQRAEAQKQVLADRQKEMMMRQQQARMQSQPPKQRAGGRRPGEGKNAYRNRMNRQGGTR